MYTRGAHKVSMRKHACITGCYSTKPGRCVLMHTYPEMLYLCSQSLGNLAVFPNTLPCYTTYTSKIRSGHHHLATVKLVASMPQESCTSCGNFATVIPTPIRTNTARLWVHQKHIKNGHTHDYNRHSILRTRLQTESHTRNFKAGGNI